MIQSDAFDVGFEQIAHVLEYQEEMASALDIKIGMWFGIGTAILGIGVPLALNMAKDLDVWTIFLAALPIIPYLFLVGYSVIGLRPIQFRPMNNPIEIRKSINLSSREWEHYLFLTSFTFLSYKPHPVGSGDLSWP